ncbi:glycosyltransferase family 2 protein [Sabulibacter ruber]|uniref:glycosyltransferase family 2 protein n=1 Tax=Sabulibacter ruber TaxID=2811901 RepID=UPI001F6261E2|nr:glycosyltransferase [Sabulibacter ruber]
MQLLAFLVVAAYAWVVLKARSAWRTLPVTRPAMDIPPVFFTVIIPVRNEAENILHLLQDLENQQYPTTHYEVIVVDDYSEDSTPHLVKQFQEKSALNLRLLFLSTFPGKRQKKAALETGINHAKGDWIICTDGDCRVSPLWLSSFNHIRYQTQAKMVSGPVMYAPTKTIWQQLQALEFSALIGMGAASIALQKPTMCNGANLAYEKEAFYEVNGFEGNKQIPSGDDEFLLHKMHQRFPGKISFLKAKEAIVSTPAAQALSTFFQQRIRWASKWKHYTSSSSQLLALLVLAANVFVLTALAKAVGGTWSWWYFLLVIGLKLGADALLLFQVLRFFGKKKLLSLIWLLQLVYVPYIVLTSVLGLTGRYQWKGRQLKTA